MSNRDDDDIGFVSPEDKVLLGLTNLYVVGCAGCLVASVWLAGTGTSLYYAFASKDNTWTQHAMSEVAVTFLLFPIAPVLFAFWKAASVAWLALSTLVAVAMLVGSRFVNGAWEHLAIGVGCGILLLQFLDLLIKDSWVTMTSDMELRAKEMGEVEATIIIGH